MRDTHQNTYVGKWDSGQFSGFMLIIKKYLKKKKKTYSRELCSIFRSSEISLFYFIGRSHCALEDR